MQQCPWEEVEATIRRLNAFVVEQDLWYSVINTAEIRDVELSMVRDALTLR